MLAPAKVSISPNAAITDGWISPMGGNTNAMTMSVIPKNTITYDAMSCRVLFFIIVQFCM